MYIDAFGLLSDSQVVTASAVTTNSINFGTSVPKRDPFAGEPLALVFGVEIAGVAGDSTYEFRAISSASPDLSAATILAARPVSVSLLTKGALVVLPVPPGIMTQQYFGGAFATGGAAPGLTCSCWLSPLSFVEKLKSYAKGYTIS